MMVDGWEHKNEWWKRGENFLVVVRHYEGVGLHPEEGPHRWFIYAYIYPQHKLFPSIKQDGGMSQEAIEPFPLHSGCTYFETHGLGDKITSYQIGCDYHHIWDERFTYIAPPKDLGNFRVFLDAEELFEWLSRE